MDENSTKPVVIKPSVDYLTVTTKDDRATATLLHAVFDLLGGRKMYQNSHKPWRFMGYAGLAFDGLRYGVRKEEGIVMLSSAFAQEGWQLLAPKRDRCTRVDLAVTVELVAENTEIAANAYQMAMDNSSVTSSLITQSRGGQTCYVGSRTSQFFGRLYDKGAEQDLPQGWVWRYEVECKKPASEAVISRLLEQENPNEWIASYVERWFQARGIVPVFTSTNVECAIELEAKVTSDDRQLQWLQSQVRPTVGRLCVAGREAEVREALGLPAQQIDLASLNKEFE